MASKTKFLRTAGSGNEYANFGQYSFGSPYGNVFFVDSTNSKASDSVGFGYSPESPFATLAYALGSTGPTTANNHDFVVCLPGHTEAVIGAGTIATANAGVTILGIGSGRMRPVITYTTNAAASFNISAANTVIDGIVFRPVGVAAVTAGINITAADVTIIGCEFELANATNQAALGILTTAAADRLRIGGFGISPHTGRSERNHFHATTDAGTAAAIRLVGGNDIRIENNYITGAYTTTKGGIDNITTACLRILIDGNTIINATAASTVAINLVSTTTGAAVNNRLSILMGTAPIVGAALNVVGNNYYAAAAGVTAGTLL